jgi:glycosyltransferase involved in cell wall biosynthesis
MAEAPAMPSVMIVIGGLDRGGAETNLLRTLPAIRGLGVEVGVLALARRGQLAPEFEAAGIPVLAPSMPAWLARASGVAGRMARLVATFWFAWRTMRARAPDIAHFYLPEAYLVGVWAALLAGVRIRIMSRRSLDHYRRRRPLLARLERAAHPFATLAIANGEAVADQLRAEGFAGGRLAIVRNGIDVGPYVAAGPRRASVRARLGVHPAAVVFAIVANGIPYKGHRDLIDALADCDVVVHESSTVAYEAMAMGIPAIRVEIGGPAPPAVVPAGNPLGPVAADAAALRARLDELAGLPQEALRAAAHAARSAYLAYFAPADADAWRRIEPIFRRGKARP